MTRFSQASFNASFRVGRKAKADKPMKPPAQRRSTKVIDDDALDAAKSELDATAADPARLTTGNTLPATGHCHTCDRAVTGERRYCGPCLARRI